MDNVIANVSFSYKIWAFPWGQKWSSVKSVQSLRVASMASRSTFKIMSSENLEDKHNQSMTEELYSCTDLLTE